MSNSGEGEKGRRGEGETGRQGDKEEINLPPLGARAAEATLSLSLPVSPCLPVSPSPLLTFSPSPSLPPRGALLGIDYGTKRIGVAVCDPDRVIASPVGTQANDTTREAYFRDLAARSRFVGIVVGLPLHASGEESPMSGEARAFAQWLAGLVNLPFVMWDERHTSFAAESALLSAGLTRKKRKEKVDRVAAQMILQTFIDAGAPPFGSDTPTPADPPEPDSEAN